MLVFWELYSVALVPKNTQIANCFNSISSVVFSDIIFYRIVASMLVTKGELRKGHVVLAGNAFAKVGIILLEVWYYQYHLE